MMNHRETWAEERRAGEDKPVRRNVTKTEPETRAPAPVSAPRVILRRSRDDQN